ncbi:MAG: hypothetical protein JNK57_08940 [Planctomycetaceae bacterium]|nr:hypothetical protein [Planctomycetaceae bacterium]
MLNLDLFPEDMKTSTQVEPGGFPRSFESDSQVVESIQQIAIERWENEGGEVGLSLFSQRKRSSVRHVR